jgi:hypothetical protein
MNDICNSKILMIESSVSKSEGIKGVNLEQ